MPLQLHEQSDGGTEAAHEASSEAVERMQLALSAGRLGDWSWNPDTDIVKLGPEAAEMLGVDPGRKITWTALRELLHPEDRERARKAVEESLASHRDYDIEYRVRKGARYVWIAARGRGIYRSDGSISEWSASFRTSLATRTLSRFARVWPLWSNPVTTQSSACRSIPPF